MLCDAIQSIKCIKYGQVVGHAIQSIEGISEKIYSKEKQKQKPIHYITNIDPNLLFSLNVNIENINSNENIFKRKNPIDYIFSKN